MVLNDGLLVATYVPARSSRRSSYCTQKMSKVHDPRTAAILGEPSGGKLASLRDSVDGLGAHDEV